MSKKITESMLKGLVEQVLNEDGFPVSLVDDEGKALDKPKRNAALGLDPRAKSTKIRDKIAKLDNDGNSLSQNDVELGFNLSWKKDSNKEAQDELANLINSTNPEIRNAVAAIIPRTDYSKTADALDDYPLDSFPVKNVDRMTDTSVNNRIGITKVDVANKIASLDGDSTNLSLEDVMKGLLSPAKTRRDAANTIVNAIVNSNNVGQTAKDQITNLVNNPKVQAAKQLLTQIEGMTVVKDMAKMWSENEFKSLEQKSMFVAKNPKLRKAVVQYAKDDNGTTNFAKFKSGDYVFVYVDTEGDFSKILQKVNKSALTRSSKAPHVFLQNNADNIKMAKKVLKDNKDSINDDAKKIYTFAPNDSDALRAVSVNYKFFENVIKTSRGLYPNKFFAEMGKVAAGQTPDVVVKKDLERTSIADPALMSQAAGEGQMLATQFDMFNTFFEGTTVGSPLETLTSRIQKISEFSNKIFKNPKRVVSEVTSASPYGATQFDLTPDATGKVTMSKTLNKYVEFSNNLLVLDYFNTFAKELDHGSGAYMFEAFCAYLAGGSVAGKETGVTGGMGETDFRFDSGAKGSAKYLQAASSFSQAEANFLVNDPVVYIFASKKKQSGAGTSSPGEIAFIDFYILKVEKVTPIEKTKKIDGESKTTIKFKIEDVAGGSVEQDLVKKGTKIEFNVSEMKPAATLSLLSVNGEMLKDAIDSYAEELDKGTSSTLNQFKSLVQAMKEAFTQIESAKDNVNSLANTGDITKAKAAKDNFKNAETNVEKLKTIYETGAQPPVTESKKVTSKLLNKLIQEKFKK